MDGCHAAIPLVTQEKWHETARHGHARGKEPVQFVENIRSYYVWLTEENQIKKNVTDVDSGKSCSSS
ncbi:MAG: hypothetical protein PHF31_00585 [Methylobacter sp.]|nr:hypothetical protein [Methylobacter sp.]